MHCRIIMLMILSAVSGIAGAQTDTRFFRVNFKSDEYLLDDADKAVLNEVIKEVQGVKYCELDLAAHTDNDAGNVYNMQLSERRAAAVSAYLSSLGVEARRMGVRWFGEKRPNASNANETGKAINRRVDIAVRKYEFNGLSDLVQQAAGQYTQVFQVNSTKEINITGNSGTTVHIPAGALETMNGQPVNSADVKIEMEEYLKPADAFFKQLSTITTDGHLLESGGMFSIRAMLHGEELRLRQGKQMDVNMPSQNMQPDMQVFVAQKNAAGITEWKATGQPFKAEMKNKVAAPHTNLNTTYLRTMRKNSVCENCDQVTYWYKIPAPPRAPYKPREPRKPVEPTKTEMFTWLQRLLLPEHVMTRKLAIERLKREDAYEERLAKYNKRQKRYESQLPKYREDSARYEQEKAEAFYAWLQQQRTIHNQSILVQEQQQFNGALTHIIALSDQNKLTAENPRALLMDYAMVQGNTALNKHRFMVRRIDALLEMSLTEAFARFNSSGAIFIGLKRSEGQFLAPERVNNYAAEMLANNPLMEQIFADAREDIQTKREKLGLMSRQTASQVYAAALSGFGSYNCDRFSSYPQNRMANITIDYDKEANISFYIPSMNCYIYAYHYGSVYTVRLPKGTKAQMVVLGYDTFSGPVFATEKKEISGDMLIKPNPQEITLADLRKNLATL